MIDMVLETLDTGNGFWHPLVWVSAFIIIFLIVFIIRGLGQKDYKKGTGQTQVFLSGNKEYDKHLMHVQSSNLYWGWTESLKWVIDALKKMHTGNVSDYVLWFVVVMGLLFLSVGLM
ncbi:MAG: hydrogenase [Candidatus Thermoplasmatota archaeon]|nr:hydrogenase [Candidatus Thermoplasmatota archaeon]